MSQYLEKAKAYRNSEVRHYNCAQSVLLSFADELGIEEETAFKIASGFGSGMKSGNVCGAITGGIMVLGLMGMDSPQNIQYLFRKIRENHENCVNCRDLLALNRKRGGDDDEHCDNMVYEVVEIIEELKAGK